MARAISIASEALRVVAGCAGGRVERCGLLFGSADRIEAAREVRNVADDPARRFEIDPAALIAAHRDARAGGPALVGCFHTHPAGAAAPSPCDEESAAGNGWAWLIVGADGAIGAWRDTAAGFVPLTLTCEGGGMR